MDLIRRLSSKPSRGKHKRSTSAPTKDLTRSSHHEDKQVLSFSKAVKGDGAEPGTMRDLLSVPKSDYVEGMADYMKTHKEGDVFPYIAVTGVEEENKDSRLARLRAFRSPYNKQNRPEMRINGIVLDEEEGVIQVQHLKEYVNADRLSKEEKKQNKKFRPLGEETFNKPYLQLSRITGEYVPLMSTTSDYTELYFTLEDGRLLDHQIIAQSVKIPTNQNGIFELSCDYCISAQDLGSLSLKYYLGRQIMKEGHQWGALSLVIRLSESDTPYITPKVEAMATIRTPFTTLEEKSKDENHADVVFTAGQVPKLRDMYKSGDIADMDEPKRERTKTSSYSKSTIRGAPKGTKGPEHLATQEGWGHLSGMIKPRIPEDQASVSVESGDDEEGQVMQQTKESWEKEQERMRQEFAAAQQKAKSKERPMSPQYSESSITSSNPKTIKRLRFIEGDDESSSTIKQDSPPDTSAVYDFN